MIPVWMDNDLGGIVYVGKNEICVLFANGIKHKICINTKDLLQTLESRSKKEIETDKYVIEPFVNTPDGCVFVTISITLTGCDEDKAMVFHDDLVRALRKVEILV